MLALSHTLLRSAVTACLLLTPALAQGNAVTPAPAKAVTQVAPTQAAPTLNVYRIVSSTVNGKTTETRVAVSSTKPGDLLERVITLVSPGTATAARLRLAVPKNTAYVAGSARATLGTVEFRATGTGFSPAPTRAATVTSGGVSRTVQVAVPEDEYTDVSVSLPVTAAGTTITFTHRILVK